MNGIDHRLARLIDAGVPVAVAGINALDHEGIGQQCVDHLLGGGDLMIQDGISVGQVGVLLLLILAGETLVHLDRDGCSAQCKDDRHNQRDGLPNAAVARIELLFDFLQNLRLPVPVSYFIIQCFASSVNRKENILRSAENLYLSGAKKLKKIKFL